MTVLATKLAAALATSKGRAPVLADKAAKAIAPTSVYKIKGKNASVRNVAMQGVASIAYAEGTARGETITRLCLVLGNKPSIAELAGAQIEYCVGRVAARLAWPDNVTIAARIIKAREIVTQMAAPAQDGKATKALRKGQTGRRSIVQHKACRAADVAWAAIKAEAGWSNAATSVAKRAKEKASRATKMSTVNVVPTLADLKPGTPLTRTQVADHIAMQAKALADYAKKHAGLVSTDMGTLVNAFQKATAKERAIVASVAHIASVL